MTNRTWNRILIWIFGGAAVVGLGVVLVPEFLRSRTLKRTKICQENLTKLDGAKEQWALEKNVSPGVLPTVADLVDPGDGTGYLKALPTCPSGHSYEIGPVGTDPVCPSGLPGHSLSDVGDVIICDFQ